MVQIALYAGLGFFAALILALAVWPALRKRTVRLTERRLRAELPQSMEEIRADRDSLRAEYAMRERQLEIMVEKLKDAAVERTLLLEGRNEEVYGLKSEARQRIEIIRELREEIEELREVGQEKDEELARHKTRIRELSGLLERRTKQLERAEIRVGELEDRIEKQRMELIETRAALRNREHYGSVPVNGHDYRGPEESPAGRLEEPAIDVARAQPPQTHAAAGAESEEAAELRDQITELEASRLALELRARTSEEELAAMEGQVAELEQKIAQLEQAGGAEATAQERAAVRELTDLRGRVKQLESELSAKDARIAALAADGAAMPGGEDSGETEALRARLIETETEKAAFEAEVTRLALELETVRAAADAGAGADETKAAAERARALESELKAARRERDEAVARATTLEDELKSVQALQDSETKIEQAEIALLRESLSELAADVANIVMTLEGEGSPIDDILRRGNGHDGSEADVVSLAERIKTLRERSVGELQG